MMARRPVRFGDGSARFCGTKPQWLTKSQEKAARAAWKEGATQQEIAAAIGVSVDVFRARRADQLANLPPRAKRHGAGRRAVDPTPEEIYGRLVFEEQARWSEEEREAKWCGLPSSSSN